uniref:uncharacterized protein LOC114679436 n=1 Tax=Macaca mulatta TaxID=9544 RepID=UPI0010A241DA|nr:uncharacterized protein LOC114679436 [Macaca mulatta]
MEPGARIPSPAPRAGEEGRGVRREPRETWLLVLFRRRGMATSSRSPVGRGAEGGSPSPPPPSLIFPPDGVTGAAICEGDFASFSPTQTRAPAGPRWVHTRTHTLAPTLAHAGAHAQVVTHQGQRRRQPEHARMALQPPSLANSLAVRPSNPHLPGAPPKKSASPQRAHTHTK